ncbi:MAG TPA: hypothetical protein VFB95_06570, partial [Candidatus Cryosericum sp.]|nr:hypothetical protein [Candidatus Cryosericum sp.]
ALGLFIEGRGELRAETAGSTAPSSMSQGPNPRDLERMLKVLKPEGVVFVELPYTNIDQNGNITIDHMTMPPYLVERPYTDVDQDGNITINSMTMPPGLVTRPHTDIDQDGNITIASMTMPAGLVEVPFSVNEAGEFLVPTLSVWGVAVLVLVLLLTGAWLLSRRGRPEPLNP